MEGTNIAGRNTGVHLAVGGPATRRDKGSVGSSNQSLEQQGRCQEGPLVREGGCGTRRGTSHAGPLIISGLHLLHQGLQGLEELGHRIGVAPLPARVLHNRADSCRRQGEQGSSGSAQHGSGGARQAASMHAQGSHPGAAAPLRLDRTPLGLSARSGELRSSSAPGSYTQMSWSLGSSSTSDVSPFSEMNS